MLILHGGVYTQTCRRAITANGTPANPITIRAADGETPIVTRPVPVNFRYDQNNVEIVNSSYLVIKGLRFKGGDGGVSFIGGHHITFEDNDVYETTEGEGLYVGCNNFDVPLRSLVRRLQHDPGEQCPLLPGRHSGQWFRVDRFRADHQCELPRACVVGRRGERLALRRGGAAAAAFTGPAQLDFWPPAGSILIGKANAEMTPAVDFNERPRVSPFDVGAYETDGLAANPGWKVAPGFKQSSSGSSNRPATPTNVKLE